MLISVRKCLRSVEAGTLQTCVQCATDLRSLLFGVAGWTGLQRYNSMPVPRPPQVNVPSRRTGPLPPLDPEALPSGQGASARQQWRRVRNEIRLVCAGYEEASSFASWQEKCCMVCAWVHTSAE